MNKKITIIKHDKEKEESLKENGIKHFIHWYTSSPYGHEDLTISEKKALSTLVKKLKNLYDIAEFIAVAHLIDGGYQILDSSFRYSTLGKAHARGVDAIAKKGDDEHLFVEIKRNTKFSDTNYRNLFSSLQKQLTTRIDKKKGYLVYSGPHIQRVLKLTDEEFLEYEKSFIKNVEGLGYLVSSNLHSKIKKLKVYHNSIAYVVDDWGTVDETTDIIIKGIKKVGKYEGR